MPTATLEVTEKQLNLIKKLEAEKVCEPEPLPTTRKEASRRIEWLLSRPRKSPAKVASATASPEAVTEPGVYIASNGDVIKVQRSKTSGGLYAKVLVHINGERLNLNDEIVDFDFVYAPGLVRYITPSMKMTKEQAMDFGLKTSRCIRCKRHLKAAKSVEASLGPVCVQYFA